MIRAVLFDLDNTLLDRDASLRKFIQAQYDRLEESVGHIPKAQYAERFIALDAHGYVWKDKVYRELVAEFELANISWEELLADYVNNFKHYCVPFSGLKKMLDELRNADIRIGLITNGRTQFQLGNIHALGIAEYFDALLVSEQERIKKPDPRIFRKALQMLEVSPKASCFVGDHPQNDIAAAQAVGIKGVWKKNEHWEDAGADYVIEGLSELSTIINQLNAKESKKEREQ